MLFEVLEDHRDGWTVLTVIGELDLGAAPRVRQAVLRAVTAADRRRDDDGSPVPLRLLFDLREVDLIDSSGLGIIMGALRRVRAAGGQLAVATVGPVRTVFEVTQLDRILALGDTLTDAMAAADGKVPG